MSRYFHIPCTDAGLLGKAYQFSDFKSDTNVYDELTKAVDALGIKRATSHRSTNELETFESLGIALKRIADYFDERLNRLRQRLAA